MNYKLKRSQKKKRSKKLKRSQKAWEEENQDQGIGRNRQVKEIKIRNPTNKNSVTLPDY